MTADKPLEQADLGSITEAATNARVQQRLDRIRALAIWDNTPKSQKKKLNLSTTVKQFADEWGVHPNRVSEDRKTAEYTKFLAEEKETAARQIDPRGTAAITESKREALANDDLAVYEQLKGQLADEAMGGDAKALEQWMKLFGSPFIQEENKRVDEVAGLDDRQLLEDILDLVDVSMLINVLKERGDL